MDQGIDTEGSNLSGVSAWCSWDEPGENDHHSSDGEDDNKENRKGKDDPDREDRRGTSTAERERRTISDYGKILMNFHLLWMNNLIFYYFLLEIFLDVNFETKICVKNIQSVWETSDLWFSKQGCVL